MSIENFLTPQQIEMLQEPQQAERLKELIEQYQRHHNNPVYVEAREQFLATQQQQINKGAEKYPEPLNPASWSVKELAQHAFEEAADLTHYIKALEIKALRYVYDLDVLGGAYKGILDDNESLVRESESWRLAFQESEKRLNEANERLHQASQDIAWLDKKINDLKIARDNWMASAIEYGEVIKRKDIEIEGLRAIVSEQAKQIKLSYEIK